MEAKKRIILQVDGGGIRGITPAILLAEIEQRIREKTGNQDFLLRDCLDLCTGTSTGAIIAGLIAAGIPAEDIKRFYTEDGVRLFRESKRLFGTRLLRGAKYNRKPLEDKLREILPKPDILLRDLPEKTTLMTTAYNLSSHRTHFIKSNKPDHADIKLRDAIRWSGLSAAYYFGHIPADSYEWDFLLHGSIPEVKPQKQTGAFFQDGGQGTQNCTLGFVLVELLRRGWENKEVTIASLGTGNYTEAKKFKDKRNFSMIKEAGLYLANQARTEATMMQVLAASYIARPEHNRNIKLFRLDYETEKEYDLDDLDNVDVYERGAQDIIEGRNWEPGNKAFDALMERLYEAVSSGSSSNS